MDMSSGDSAAYSRALTPIFVQAVNLAQAHRHNYAGSEHVFLAFRALPLAHEIARLLHAVPLDWTAFYLELGRSARAVPSGFAPPRLPWTPRMRNILAWARDFASLNHLPEVTPTHLILSIANEGTSLPANLLKKFYRQSHPQVTRPDPDPNTLQGHLPISRHLAPWKLPPAPTAVGERP